MYSPVVRLNYLQVSKNALILSMYSPVIRLNCFGFKIAGHKSLRKTNPLHNSTTVIRHNSLHKDNQLFYKYVY